jgi:hypothetical protein
MGFAPVCPVGTTEEIPMSVTTLLIILLVLVLIGALPV